MQTTSRIFLVAVLLLSACGSVPGKANPDDPSGNFSLVSEGVYRGGRPDQAGIDALVKLGVRTIIDLENDDAVIAQEREWALKAGLTFVSAPMNGMATPNDEKIEKILDLMHQQQPVFVHCMEGRDRTGLIVGLYRVLYESWLPKDAYDEMLAHGFRTMLIAMKKYFEDKTGWDD